MSFRSRFPCSSTSLLQGRLLSPSALFVALAVAATAEADHSVVGHGHPHGQMSEAAMDMHETYKDMPGFHRQSHAIPSGYIHHMQYHGPMDHVKPAVPHKPHHAPERPAYGYPPPRSYPHPEPAYHRPEPAYKKPEPMHKHPEPAYAHPEPMHNSVHTHAAVDLKATAVAHPKPAAHAAEPDYLGTFRKATSKVEGDIFKLDDHTIYIQGFSFDGHAPNAVFWSDGIEIPYYTRYTQWCKFMSKNLNFALESRPDGEGKRAR